MAVDVIFVCDEVGNVDAEDQRKLEEIGRPIDTNNNLEDQEMVTEFGDDGNDKIIQKFG